MVQKTKNVEKKERVVLNLSIMDAKMVAGVFQQIKEKYGDEKCYESELAAKISKRITKTLDRQENRALEENPVKEVLNELGVSCPTLEA